MGVFTLQPSMSAGEISPLLWGHVDLAKFAAGLKSARNFFIHPQGGASNRAGTEFVVEVKDSSKATRLKAFRFNDAQTYILEFGDLYLRVIRNGAQVVYPAGDPNEGDPAEIATPYLEADLATLQHAQDLDVLFLAHGSYAPRTLARTDHHAWTLATQSFEPDINGPSAVTVSSSGSGTSSYRYMVTAVDPDTGQESIRNYLSQIAVSAATQANPVEITLSAAIQWEDGDDVFLDSLGGMTELNDRWFRAGNISWAITGATQANPCELTVSGHPWVTGDSIRISEVGGMTELNDGSTVYAITVTGANTFTLDGVDSTGYGAYTSGGVAKARYKFTLIGEDGTGHTAYTSGGGAVGAVIGAVEYAASLAASGVNTITWILDPDVERYEVYREENQLFGWIGGTNGSTFVDANITADMTLNPRRPRNPFDTAAQYPAAVSLHAKRLVYGATSLVPDGLWMSRPMLYGDFTISADALRDDDAITERLVAHTANPIQHLRSLKGLIAFTTGQDFVLSSDGPVAPGSLYAEANGARGASAVPPVLVGGAILYPQERGSLLWEVAYSYEANGLVERELTVLAEHLFRNLTIVAQAYQRIPYPIVWIVLSNGSLVGLTYLKEHDIYAFHHHDSAGGLFEDVAVVPEGAEDRVYFVVNRTVEGATVRYIERLASRGYDDQADAVFLDCSLTYDGAPAQTITGLDHLEGETVYALADGAALGPLTVASGSVDLGASYSTVTVGLAYTQELQNLDLDIAPAVRGRKRRITHLQVLLDRSRSDGLQAGPSADNLMPFAGREISDTWAVPEIYTGVEAVTLTPEWGDTAGLFIRNTLPLPVTILSVLPEFDVGG